MRPLASASTIILSRAFTRPVDNGCAAGAFRWGKVSCSGTVSVTPSSAAACMNSLACVSILSDLSLRPVACWGDGGLTDPDSGKLILPSPCLPEVFDETAADSKGCSVTLRVSGSVGFAGDPRAGGLSLGSRKAMISSTEAVCPDDLRIFVIVPDSGAGTSSVALSVSMVTTSSSRSTKSPSFLSQSPISTWEIDSPTAGTLSSIDTADLSLALKIGFHI